MPAGGGTDAAKPGNEYSAGQQAGKRQAKTRKRCKRCCEKKAAQHGADGQRRKPQRKKRPSSAFQPPQEAAPGPLVKEGEEDAARKQAQICERG